MAGTMNSGMNVGLPADHWIHKAMAKEKGRMAKKASGPARTAPAKPMMAKAVMPTKTQMAADNGDHEYR